MVKKPLNIRPIHESLRDDYLHGRLTAHGVAAELYVCGWTPYVTSDEDALAQIGVKPWKESAYPPSILDGSIKKRYRNKELTAHGVAVLLWENGYTPYVLSDKDALAQIGVEDKAA